jgi:hypothetical protein
MPRFVEPHQRGRNLGHLHQADRAFLHARAARSRDTISGMRAGDAALDGARDLLAHHAPMLPPMNFGSMAQMLTGRPSSFPSPRSARLSATSPPAWRFQPVLVGFLIDEPSGSEDASSRRAPRNAVVEQHGEARAGVHAEMMAALAADVQGELEIFLPDDFRQPSHFSQRPSVRTVRSARRAGGLVGIRNLV